MAAITSAVVVAGSAAYAANKQSSAAKQGSRAIADSTQASNDLQWKMYQQTRNDGEQFRQNGITAQNEYMSLLGLPSAPGAKNPAWSMFNGGNSTVLDPAQQYLIDNPDVAAAGVDPWTHYINGGGHIEGRTWGVAKAPEAVSQPAQQANPQQSQQAAFDRFRNQPGYQFAQQEMQRGTENSAAARGNLLSGATAKALQRNSMGLADQTFGDYMNRLASVSGQAQTQNAQNAAYGANVTGQMGSNLLTAGAARASGLQQSANAYGQMAGVIGGQVNNWYQQRQAQQTPAYTGNGTGAGSYGGFGNNLSNFTGRW